MRTLVALCALLCLVVANEQASDCQLKFLTNLAFTNDAIRQCNLIRLYNKCLKDLNLDVDTAEPFTKTLTDMSVVVPECNPDHDPIEGSDFAEQPDTVETDKTFNRMKRDTVSVSQLESDIADLQTMASAAASNDDVNLLVQMCQETLTGQDMTSMTTDAINQQKKVFETVADTFVDGAKTRIASAKDKASSCATTSTLEDADWQSSVETAQSAILEAIASAEGIVNAAEADVNGDVDAIRAELHSFLTSTRAALDNLRQSAYSQADALEKTINQAIDNIEARAPSEEDLNDAVESLADKADAAKQSMVTAIAERKFPLFSGFCSQHGQGSSDTYLPYCIDSIEFNSLDPFMELVDRQRGIMRVKKAGMFRVKFFCISLSSAWSHIQVVVNGVYRHHGHQYSGNYWTDNFADITWPMSEGDEFYVLLYRNGNSYHYHRGSWFGSHSRIQVSYQGTYE